VKASKQEVQQNARQVLVKKLAAIALAENERLAEQGDAYGELRMGERYLTGDGVAKDIFKARDYLQRAAEQGSQTAAQELDRLNNQN
jgi:TPR repeat protein